MENELSAGNILSYSASSTQTGPSGYRVVRKSPPFLAKIFEKWPKVGSMLDGGPPIIINSYPANVGSFEFGVFVDTYLSNRTASRALQLAAVNSRCAIILGQPLFVADLILRHASRGLRFPENIVLAVGGYHMPMTLQATIESCLGSEGIKFFTIHCYGAAEVDAACLIGADRDQNGSVVYFERSTDVEVMIADSELLLNVKSADGRFLFPTFHTGDYARPHNDGFVIENDTRRLSLKVKGLFETWGSDQWTRRTGYLHQGRTTIYQLREGIDALAPNEISYFGFAESYGDTWLTKPRWGET